MEILWSSPTHMLAHYPLDRQRTVTYQTVIVFITQQYIAEWNPKLSILLVSDQLKKMAPGSEVSWFGLQVKLLRCQYGWHKLFSHVVVADGSENLKVHWVIGLRPEPHFSELLEGDVVHHWQLNLLGEGVVFWKLRFRKIRKCTTDYTIAPTACISEGQCLVANIRK